MNECRASDEMGSDYTDQRAERNKTGQCSSDPEDSAYAAGHRDGYADARSDKTVDPVWRQETSDIAPRDWYQCEGLAMPGTQFDTYEEAREAGLKFVRSRMDDGHYPGSFQVRKYTSLGRIA